VSFSSHLFIIYLTDQPKIDLKQLCTHLIVITYITNLFAKINRKDVRDSTHFCFWHVNNYWTHSSLSRPHFRTRQIIKPRYNVSLQRKTYCLWLISPPRPCHSTLDQKSFSLPSSASNSILYVWCVAHDVRDRRQSQSFTVVPTPNNISSDASM